jgi:hypothetical protein
MTLLWVDGFETDATLVAIGRRYPGATASLSSLSPLATGRHGGLAMKLLPGATTRLPTPQLAPANNQLQIGLAINASKPASGPLLTVQDTSSQEQFTLNIWSEDNARFFLHVRRGDRLIAESPALPQQQWLYVEMLASIHPALGYVELRVSGAVILRANDLNTSRRGTEAWGAVVLSGGVQAGSPAGYLMFDDFVVGDNAGELYAGPLGDVIIRDVNPVGDAAPNTWTNPGAPQSHTAQVDDAIGFGSVDDDASYLSAAPGIGFEDWFRFSSFPYTPLLPGPIHALVVSSDVRLQSAGASEFFLQSVRMPDGDVLGGSVREVSSASYSMFHDTFVAPPTRRMFLPEDLLDLEMGVIAL